MAVALSFTGPAGARWDLFRKRAARNEGGEKCNSAAVSLLLKHSQAVRGHVRSRSRRGVEIRRCRHELRELLCSDAPFHGLGNLLESVHLDLPHAFARNTKLDRELVERGRIIRQPARLKYAALALIQQVERLRQRAAAVLCLLALGQNLSPRSGFRPPANLATRWNRRRRALMR